MRPPKQTVCLIAVLVCFCIWSASGQQSAQQPSTTPSVESTPSANATQPSGRSAQPTAQSEDVLRVTSRMVIVDAVVTDSNGKPVPDLKAEDFKIFEDGQPQTIRGFGARSPELLKRQAALVPPPQKLPPDLFTNITDFHPEYGPLTIFLVDSLNTPREDQVYMRKALLQYLQAMGPRKNVVIFSLGAYLGLVQDLNADSGLLLEALKRIETDSSLKNLPKENPAAIDPDSRSRVLAANLLGVGETYDREREIEYMRQSMQEFTLDQSGLQADYDVGTTLAALRKIAQSVAGYPGRKNLIWLSDGFPLFTDPSIVGSVNAISLLPYIQQTANLLTNNEIAVYPVDVKGLVTVMPEPIEGMSLAESMGRKLMSIGAFHSTMEHLAEQTGGRAFYNRNDFEREIETSVQDGSTYYTLGYYPTNKNWNGKFRSIELKVNGKGLHAHYRRGYYAMRAVETAEARRLAPRQQDFGQQEFQAALALDAPSATLLPVVTRVTAPTKEHPHIYVDIAVDPHSVIFEAQPNSRARAEVEFVTIVLDANGKPVTSKLDILNANLSPQTFAQVMATRLSVRQIFDLQAGKYLLRIGVRDMKSNLIGTVIAKVEVIAPQ